jgi:hypothetical protein
MRSCAVCTYTENYSGDQIKKNKVEKECDTYGKGEVHAGVSWGNLKEGSPGHKWEDNIKIGFKEIG